MWVDIKKASEILDKGERAIQIAIERATKGGKPPPYQYRYVEGLGRGGKKLEIYIEEREDGGKAEKEDKTSQTKAQALQERNRQRDSGTDIPGAKRETDHKRPRENRQNIVSNGERANIKYLAASKEEQAEALRKAKLCEAYLKRERGVTFEEFSKSFDGLPSRGQFFRWLRTYKKARKSGAVLDAFVDERGRPKGSGKLTAEMKEMCQRYVLRSDTHANKHGIYQNLKHAFKEATPSYETVCRYIEAFKEANKQLIAFATNPDKARGKYRAAFGNMSVKATHKNHYWELDGTPADIITADGKRPAIVGAIDIYSRRVVITVEEKTNSYALSRNLRAGILKLGIPEIVVTDNGRDYKSNHFESVLLNFNIEKQEVEPYAGYKKPHIERFFGTMTRELFRELEGFCGHDVAERQGIRNMLTFEQRLEAKRKWREQKYTENSFARAMHKEGAQIFIPLTRDELAYWVNAWVEAVYERRVHSKTGESPYDRYKNDIMPANMMFDKRSLDILLGERLEYTVSKKGIVIKRDGAEAQYFATELIELIGEKVLVVLDDDMSSIVVYRHDMSFVCEAKDLSLENISREQMREIQRLMRKAESDKLKTVRKAEQVAQTLGDPSIKDRIEESMKSLGVDTRPTAKVRAKTVLDEAPPPKQTKKYFKSSTELLKYVIENGLENEEEYQDEIRAQYSLYTDLKKEFEIKKKVS
ncbi:MAG: DDE-type integrase/transposase/recombinase [Campylobacterales bacterium]|nr:DDE-type integrase/transposase/recombinase [Campylobacterales bacterium]